MADPGEKGAGDKKIKMPWGMKIGGLKPGAKETITDKKLKTFVVGKQKKSRLQKVRGTKSDDRGGGESSTNPLAWGLRMCARVCPLASPPPACRAGATVLTHPREVDSLAHEYVCARREVKDESVRGETEPPKERKAELCSSHRFTFGAVLSKMEIDTGVALF